MDLLESKGRIMEFVRISEDNVAYLKSIVKEFRNQEISDEKALSFIHHPSIVCFACVDDEKAVGYVYAYRLPRMDNGNDILDIYHLFVNENYRRQGIARKLMEMMLNYAEEEKIHYALLLTGSSFTAARKLYESLGGYNHPEFKETYYWYITGKPQP